MSTPIVKELVESVKNELNATSCTFYLRDPFWSDELRLIAMPGVQFTEPMYGFSFPSKLQNTLSKDDVESFNSDIETLEQHNEHRKISLARIDPGRQMLFGDFVIREGVKSLAKLIHKVDKHIEAILFVNYDTVVEFDEALKDKIRHQFKRLVDRLPDIDDELRSSDAENIHQIDRIFSPTRGGARNLIYDWKLPLKEYLHSLLTILTESIPALEPDKAFGTIHIYEPESQTLKMIAHTDSIDPESFPKLSVLDGEGVISWVAIRRKAILIDDLDTSNFKSIHISLKEDTKSEIAIPIFAEKDLLGVLNLESFVPNAFQPDYVKSLWFAVSQAATAYQLSRQANLNAQLKSLSDGLLRLCEECVNTNTGNFSLDRLAILATEHLGADEAGIWRYNSHDDKFVRVGISKPDYEPLPPRSSGFSECIRKVQRAFWLTRIEDSTRFSIFSWDVDNHSWNEPSDEKLPASLNIDYEVKELLGIPIVVRGVCIGIAWLEYKQREIRPSEDFMKLALGFAAHAGLVIEFSLVDLVDKEAVQSIGEALSKDLLAQGWLNLEGFSGIDGYVKSQSYSSSLIGGDFYAARVVDEQTACILLGDGEGHAIQGTLNMLPMLTVFETFWKETRSVTHIMDKIMRTSTKMGVRGTVICCIFNIIKKKLWLSVTSSGHQSAFIFPKVGPPEMFPEEDSPASVNILAGEIFESPRQEDHRPMRSGDLLILLTDGFNLTFDEILLIGVGHKTESLDSIAQAVFDFASAKRGNVSSDDDETVMVIRVR